MPNVVLLIPIADILDVTVTELLRGEKIDTQKNIDTKEIEELVVGSLDMAVRDSVHQHRKNWILAYLLCLFISITEIIEERNIKRRMEVLNPYAFFEKLIFEQEICKNILSIQRRL